MIYPYPTLPIAIPIQQSPWAGRVRAEPGQAKNAQVHLQPCQTGP
jgi:hypothetical protein